MKIPKLIVCLILMVQLCTSCIFVYDPARGRVYVLNRSQTPIYFFIDYAADDSIPEIPNRAHLSLVDTMGFNSYTVYGSREHPKLLCGSITIFSLTEDMVRQHTLKEIHDQQIYEKKIILTEEDLKAINWEIIYPFEKNKIKKL